MPRRQGDLSTPPRLAVVADTAIGGLGSAAIWHANYFVTRGWEVVLISPSDDGRPAALDHIAEWMNWRAPLAVRHVSGMVRSAKLLGRSLAAFRPDFVHVHGLRSFAATRAVWRRTFVTNHTFDTISRPWSPRGMAYRILPRLAVEAFAVAPGLGRGWTVLTHASPRLGHLREVTPSSSEPLTVLWLGRLTPQKRPEDFVRAIAAAASTAHIVGIMVGDGPLLETCRALVAQLAAPITVAGALLDVQRLFDRSDVFCLLSNFEGIPFAVQEAMWCGLPTVLSPLPTLRHFAGNAAVYAQDAQQAAEHFVRLADLPLRQRLARLARSRAREMVSPEWPGPAYADAYRRCGPGG